MGGIDYNRDPPAHRIAEFFLQVQVRPFRHLGGVAGQLLFLGEEVDLEMGGLHLLPFELGELNLVLAEAVQLRGAVPMG